jgi:polar amino acid transport system substrate-binding protein
MASSLARLGAASFAALLAVSSPAARADMADHPTDQKLRVAAEVGFAPFDFRLADGSVTGFSFDVGQEIAKRLGRPGYEVVDIVFANIYAALQAKRIEYIIAPMTVTPQRAAEMLFGQPYFDVALAFLTRADSPAKTIEDFRGKTVAVTSGSVQDEWMKANAATYGIEVSRFDKTADAVQAVAIKRVSAYMTTSSSALWTVKNQPVFAADVIVKTNGVFALPFREDDTAFRDLIDDKLKCMKQDGTLAAIYRKWFGAEPAADSATVKIFPGHGAPGWPGYVADAAPPVCP